MTSFELEGNAAYYLVLLRSFLEYVILVKFTIPQTKQYNNKIIR